MYLLSIKPLPSLEEANSKENYLNSYLQLIKHIPNDKGI